MAAGSRSGAARTIGVDTGGTFTDLVLEEPDAGPGEDSGPEPRVAKLPSTPDDPAAAVVVGLGQLCAGGAPGAADHVIHGTTVALNALLTGRVARAALVTGEGFRDLLEIGRQDRPDIYALHPVKPRPLIERARRFTIASRAWPDPGTGRVTSVREPTRAELDELVERVRRSGAESVAICLLHSWADASAEERVAEALAPLGLPLSLSAHILPEHREVERFSTAAVNAVLAPLVSAYLGGLDARLVGARLSILQSSGGTLPAARAAAEPVRVILSGPAGGVVGAGRAAAAVGFEALVTLDMGGTSTDVAFHRTRDAAEGHRAPGAATVAGHPVGVPALDIHTIGCGGGSLVHVDAGGAMHVGPESAGADPGPVCYGASDRPTVTDAHVLLGHVAEGPFLSSRGGLASGGGLPLDTDAVARAFGQLGRRLGVRPERAAEGVLEVARAGMRRAVGVMTMQRGQDPQSLPLVAFGGAGGLHAAALAGGLGMPAALVPRHPGLLSARGMARADAIRDLTRSVLEPLASWPRAERRRVLDALAAEARRELVSDGHAARAIELEATLDLRYRGQSFELSVPEGRDPAATFHAAHERLYGYRLEAREIELVCLRLRARVRHSIPTLPTARARPLPRAALLGRRRARFGSWLQVPVVDRARLAPGHRFEGPALVEEFSGTTLVPPGWTARVVRGGHLLLAPGSAPNRA